MRARDRPALELLGAAGGKPREKVAAVQRDDAQYITVGRGLSHPLAVRRNGSLQPKRLPCSFQRHQVAQLLLQQPELVTQGVAAIDIDRVGPEQVDEVVTRRGPRRRGVQVDKQRQQLGRLEEYLDPARCAVSFERRAPEAAQEQAPALADVSFAGHWVFRLHPRTSGTEVHGARISLTLDPGNPDSPPASARPPRRARASPASDVPAASTCEHRRDQEGAGRTF